MTNTTHRVLSGLGRVWRDQLALQVRLIGVPPSELDDDEKMRYITEQALAVNLEVGEALLETGHKSWATSNHVNRDAYLAELRDAWQHLINLMLVVDATPGELVALMRSKHKVNHERINTNYDGVTTKCPRCHRAYDDPAVKCTPVHADPEAGAGAAWCEIEQDWVATTHPLIRPDGHGTIAGYKLASDCPGTPHRGHTDPAKPCPMDVEVSGAGVPYPGKYASVTTKGEAVDYTGRGA